MTDAPPPPLDPSPATPSAGASVDRAQWERAAAARAHLGAFWNVIPLLGVFMSIGTFRTHQDRSI